MSFARNFILLWLYQTGFLGLFVDCAALDRRSVTFVTKVVGITTFVNPLATPTSASPDGSNDVDVLTKVVRVGPTTVDTANCNPLQCTANVASVSVFYWPQESARTACLSTISDLPSALPPPGLIPQSPSVYAIFHSLALSNGCGTLSTAWDSVTMSFPPGALSTVAPFAATAEVFNFADLPCPPPGLYVEPGQLYQPQFAVPRAFFSSLKAAYPDVLNGCGDGVWTDGWTDPPIAFVTAGPLDGPGQPGGAPRRLMRGVGLPENAHVVARAPTKTVLPS